MNSIDIPIVTGPGSQPPEEDGLEIDFRMPSGMTTFSAPEIPEPDEIEGLDEAIALMAEIQAVLATYRAGQPAVVLPLNSLDEKNTDLINQMIGNGEVSMNYHGAVDAQIQESVLAGVWRVQYLGANGEVQRDVIEVAGIPSLVKEATFNDAAAAVNLVDANIPCDVYNAPPLLTEIDDKLPEYRPGDVPHVINLSLLPHTNEDIEFLSATLGIGPVVILSRGYGNCRISSTATKNVWWVQYFNSQDTLILNTLEISEVPDVACAAQEDIDDSAARLLEILGIYQ